MTIQQEFASIAPTYLPEPHASLLNGMLLGISIKHTGDFYRQSIDSGLIHLVVVSGTNVSLLANGLLIILASIHLYFKILLIIITIVLFMIVVGIEPPVFRATVMSCLSLLGLLTGRKYYALYSLLISCVLSAVFRPDWLSTLSFYLTYLSTSGIILFAKPLTTTLEHESVIKKVQLYILSELQTAIAAQTLITPLLYFYFGRISLISIFTNVLVSWSIVPIMINGFLLMLFHYISTDVCYLLSQPLYVLLNYVVQVIRIFS